MRIPSPKTRNPNELTRPTNSIRLDNGYAFFGDDEQVGPFPIEEIIDAKFFLLKRKW